MEWLNAVVQGVLLGGLYALLATGLSLVFGVMRLVNLAHGDLGILAAFLAVVVVEATGVKPFLSLVVVVPMMMAVGYVLQRGLLNRTLDGGVLPPVLVTFGIAVVIQNSLLDGVHGGLRASTSARSRPPACGSPISLPSAGCRS